MSSSDDSRLVASSRSERSAAEDFEVRDQQMAAADHRTHTRNRAAARQNRWILATAFDSGDAAYWGENRSGYPGLTPFRGNAYRYESEADALDHIPDYRDKRFTAMTLP